MDNIENVQDLLNKAEKYKDRPQYTNTTTNSGFNEDLKIIMQEVFNKESNVLRDKYNSQLDINMKIRIRRDIKKDLKQEIVVKRTNEGIKEKVNISFLVPNIIKDNQVIVLRGEGNRRNNECGNLNIKVIKH